MNELVPLITGAILAFAVLRSGTSHVYAAALVLAMPLGILASWVTGELRISWGFLLVDIPLVAVAAGVVLALGGVPSAGKRAVARRPRG